MIKNERKVIDVTPDDYTSSIVHGIGAVSYSLMNSHIVNGMERHLISHTLVGFAQNLVDDYIYR